MSRDFRLLTFTDLASLWVDRLLIEVKVGGQVKTGPSYIFTVEVGDNITLKASVEEITAGLWPTINWENVDGETLDEQQDSVGFEKTFTTEGNYTYRVKSQLCQEESKEYTITFAVTGEV